MLILHISNHPLPFLLGHNFHETCMSLLKVYSESQAHDQSLDTSFKCHKFVELENESTLIYFRELELLAISF